jgi:L-threonylcarbamoyladenylate synthase
MKQTNTQVHNTASWATAVKLLQSGGVGVIPTDTVYGLAASASNMGAVECLYSIKNRERKPGTIIASSVDQLIEFGFDAKHLGIAGKWWPNPISVIVPAGQEMFYLHQGLNSLPIRIPKDENLRQFLAQTGVLITSSANLPGEPESANVAEAQKYFEQSVDFYVNGGDLSGRKASTLIKIDSDGKIDVLRQGEIDINNFV